MTNTPLKQLLHVGCGAPNKGKLPAVFRDESVWNEVRLDIDESVKPDIISSMTDMPMVEADSMDALFSSHNIEHLYRHEVQGALKEFLRVIKPGGQLIVTLPDIQTTAAYVAEGSLEEALYESPGGPIEPIDIMYGWSKKIAQGNHFMAHKTGFSAKTLATHLLQAGFSNVQVRREWVDLWAVAIKLPEGHPDRKMQAQLINARMHGPKGQRLPFWYERKLQLQSQPDARTDALEAPPQLWKPLGLNNA